MVQSPIRGFLSNTLIDWEGKIAAEIFLSGCNFRCPFCHSAILVLGCDLERIPLQSVLNCIKSEQGWIDGVVISGGEPTLEPELEVLCTELKSYGLAVKIDTNGTAPDVIRKLISLGLIDCVSLDVKAPLDSRYGAATGVENPPIDKIKQTIELLERSSLSGRGQLPAIDYEFRTTVVPTLHGRSALEDIAKSLTGGKEWVLQQFNPKHCLNAEYEKIKPYDLNFLREVARDLSHYLPTRVRGDYSQA